MKKILYLVCFSFLGCDIPNTNNYSPPDSDPNYQTEENYGFLVYKKGEIKKTFENLAGLEEVKKSLEPIIYYLTNPEDFKRLGATPPSGAIFYGPPGTGKTEIARTLAGEVNKVRNVAFIYAAGSAFESKYVGSGAKKVRQLFTLARKNKPAIIFIDEFDALAAKRSEGFKNVQMVNQLLTELDGFNEEDRKDIFIIAATNFIENIDPAIIRPGRIDRKIFIPLPNEDARRALINHFFTYKEFKITGIDIDWLVRETNGWSAAELEQLVNEARQMATINKDETITNKHFEAVLKNLKDNKINSAPKAGAN